MTHTWLQIRDMLNQADAEFLAQPAAAGAHPDELFPLFGLARLAAPAHLGYLSDGEPQLLPVPVGSHYLSTARICRVCQCTELDCSGCVERTGIPCHWLADDLCSACGEPAAETDAPLPPRKSCLAHTLAPIS